MKTLLIDNYDSFTYNLVHLLINAGISEAGLSIRRNDDRAIWKQLEEERPDLLVISPGPNRPEDSGYSMALIERFKGPLLGICMGMQCMGKVYGAQVRPMDNPVHGKTTEILHGGESIFGGLPSPLTVARYHSLSVRMPLPAELKLLAWSDDGVPMAIGHRVYPHIGLQFHPESFLSELGLELIRSFLNIFQGSKIQDCNG